MITYNHENYIREAIEGVLMQKTPYPLELVIGDDCSTDNTPNICNEYKAKYPNKIRLLLQEKNIGANLNFITTLQSCTGKYIALCEGDDYWTDPNKLQIQVEYLINNPDFAICFHNARTLIQETGDDKNIIIKTSPKDEYTIKDVIKHNIIPTLTCMFRNNLAGNFPKWYFDSFPGDWPLHILNAQYGKIKYIDKIMGVYRIHEGGAVSLGKHIESNYKRYIKTLTAIGNGKEIKHKRTIAYAIYSLYCELFVFYIKEKDYSKALSTIYISFKEYIVNLMRFN